MTTTQIEALAERVRDRLVDRNELSSAFFEDEAMRLATICRKMAAQFEEGGRLIALGREAYTTDAQHVSVEFVHPVIVGKRALPAIDASPFMSGIKALVREQDIVMGFGPPGGDTEVEVLLADLHETGILTLALPGRIGHYATVAPTDDPFVHQEVIEVLYHTLWETVHVFFEHREMGHDVGEAEFLYPFLGRQRQDTEPIVDEVAESIVGKAKEDERLRILAAERYAETLVEAAAATAERIRAGGKLIVFGNGGSATDANDLVIDCLLPPKDLHPIPAISLSAEPANISAVANDIGEEAIFLRQLIAHAGAQDVVVAFSTSGSSRNVLAALREARNRQMLTIAFLGYDGGEIVRRELSDFPIVVESDYIPRIQEIHASLYHLFRELLEDVRSVDF